MLEQTINFFAIKYRILPPLQTLRTFFPAFLSLISLCEVLCALLKIEKRKEKISEKVLNCAKEFENKKKARWKIDKKRLVFPHPRFLGVRLAAMQ